MSNIVNEIGKLMENYGELGKNEIVQEAYSKAVSDAIKELIVLKNAKETTPEIAKALTLAIEELKRIIKEEEKKDKENKKIDKDEKKDKCKCKNGDKCKCDKDDNCKCVKDDKKEKINEASMKGKYTGRIIKKDGEEDRMVGEVIRHRSSGEAVYAIHAIDEDGKAGKKVGDHGASYVKKYSE